MNMEEREREREYWEDEGWERYTNIDDRDDIGN